tara:strand:- start:4877 stop:5338 length:462 start_codon:yes stop_codon:yes gene_type:complete
MKSNIKSTLIAITALTLGACSTLPKAPVYQVDAKVMNVKKAPEVCTEEVKKSKTKATSQIGGGIIGGLIGNQFGSGNGRKAMTGLGAILGVVAVTDIDKKTGKYICKSDGYIATVTYIHPETKSKKIEYIPLKRKTRAEWVTIPVYGKPVATK